MSPVRRFLALLLVAAPGLTASAWEPSTRIRMVDEAVRIMPASLRLALEHHREPLLRGLLEPQVREDDATHKPHWLGGSLDEEIERRARALIASVERAAPFSEIASNFGALAHFVADAGFPPAMTPDGASRYAHFSEFCESRRERFPLVFYGHDEPNLAQGDYRAFGAAFMERARGEDEPLRRAYVAAGQPPDPAYFDDRSVPFAIGSLSYSHTITNVVRAWLAAWKDSNGDLGRTPYRKTEKKKKRDR
jgi:hypothetical protein